MVSAATSSVIATRGLAHAFGPVTAIAALDLDVQRGELFGLIGPDGAGKSTAIRLLCGLLRPTGGEGSVLGCDLRGDPARIKAQIGYLAQEFTLYGDVTVDENFSFFAGLHGVSESDSRREELLEFTRLTPFRTRLAGALSGGMKKKLALACTLIHTPALLLLDEPTTGVDPVSRGEFWSILGAVLERGVTIVMTTPYLDEAERCHRICLLNAGRVILTGTPDKIKGAMPGLMYEIFSPDSRATYAVLRNKWPAAHLVLLGDRVRFWAPVDENGVTGSLAILKAEGIEPTACVPVLPTLEDAMIGLLADLGLEK